MKTIPELAEVLRSPGGMWLLKTLLRLENRADNRAARVKRKKNNRLKRTRRGQRPRRT